jgi:CelD/BcsL family acetyltransferase involved in cellulose biosynthesis
MEAMHRPFDSEEIITLARLEELLPEWKGLWSSAQHSTPFQFPEWIIGWWRCFGAGRLAVLALRDGKRLVALVAGAVREGTATDGAIFELLGGGISDYQDALFAPRYQAASMPQVLAWLEQMNREHCDHCRLEQLPEFSPFVTVPLAQRCFDQLAPGDVCPVLRLCGNELAGCIPTAQAAKLRYYRRRAERRGALNFQTADGSNWPELLDDLLELHRRSWSRRGQCGVLAGAPVERFHRAVAPQLLRAGLLRLYRLRIEGRAVASLYVLMYRARACYYIGGFDPEFSDLSPGTLLIGYAIERAIAEGAVEFDFLRGQERYKYFWGAKDRPTYRRLLQRSRVGESAKRA